MLFRSSANDRQGTANPLLLLAATRGRLMELLAAEARSNDGVFTDQAFMVGIMSLIPALIGLPIQEIITPLGLATPVHQALCDRSGELGALLRLTESCEDGDLAGLREVLAALPNLGPKAVNRAQTEALQWANDISREREG